MVVSNLSPIPQKQSTQKPKDKFKGMPYCPNTVNKHVVTSHFIFFKREEEIHLLWKTGKNLELLDKVQRANVLRRNSQIQSKDYTKESL